MKTIAYSVGIDIAKNTCVFRIGKRLDDYSAALEPAVSICNDLSGFQRLLERLEALKKEGAPLVAVMEATGAYHEKLAYFLYEKGYKVYVVLPNKIKNFGKSFNQKAKTDPLDAGLIARYGLERDETAWEPPPETLRKLKHKSRELESLTQERVKSKVRMQSLNSAYNPDKQAVKRLNTRIALLEKQEQEVLKEMETLVASEPELERKAKQIEAVEGLGRKTILKVIAETGGFERFTSGKQVAGYAGLDVVVHESGIFKGKGKLTKKGNPRLREMIYLPAMTAVRCNGELKAFYLRLVSRGKAKKAALLAVARKLLLLIYTLWKSDRPYDPNYLKNISTAKN